MSALDSHTISTDLALGFLWRHAWAYADTYLDLTADEVDAYAIWFVAQFGDDYLAGERVPEHPMVFHAWRERLDA